MSKRFFTVDAAREVLPYIREMMDQVMVIMARLKESRPEVQSLADSSALNTGSPAGTRYAEDLAELRECLLTMEQTGCIVKSVQDGLVDFPHLREGREVYLCWKYGETDIQYWHEVDAGFAGRTPLE